MAFLISWNLPRDQMTSPRVTLLLAVWSACSARCRYSILTCSLIYLASHIVCTATTLAITSRHYSQNSMSAQATDHGMQADGPPPQRRVDMHRAEIQGLEHGLLKDSFETIQPYLPEGAAMMVDFEEGRRAGGILADGPGLEKRWQCLAVIAHGIAKRGQKLPTLIAVANVAVFDVWEREIEKHTRLSAGRYHGSHRDDLVPSLKGKDIVLTTVNMLRNDLSPKAYKRIKKQRSAKPDQFLDFSNEDLIGTSDTEPGYLFSQQWERVYIDDAQ